MTGRGYHVGMKPFREHVRRVVTAAGVLRVTVRVDPGLCPAESAALVGRCAAEEIAHALAERRATTPGDPDPEN